jgi:outer membrane biosynthesis protein TonB
MRAGFAISVVGHGTALLLVLFFAGVNPFDSAPAEAITVDIVTPAEVPPSAPENMPPETKLPDFPDLTKIAPATSSSAAAPAAAPQEREPAPQKQEAAPQKQQAEPQKPPPERQQPRQQPPQKPPPRETAERNTGQAMAALTPPNASQPASAPTPFSQPNPERAPTSFADVFGMPITLPDGRLGGGFDSLAYDQAKIAISDTTAFREHLKSCSTLPSSLSPADNIKIVLRVAFRRDGTLAADPTLVEASASAKGPALMASAIKALRDCQPYTMLPADKYDEWKIIDMPFTPQDMRHG